MGGDISPLLFVLQVRSQLGLWDNCQLLEAGRDDWKFSKHIVGWCLEYFGAKAHLEAALEDTEVESIVLQNADTIPG